jgi:hypothetical protein
LSHAPKRCAATSLRNGPRAAALGARIAWRPMFSPDRRCGSIHPTSRSSLHARQLEDRGRRRDERHGPWPACRRTVDGGNGAGRQARLRVTPESPTRSGAGKILRCVSLRRERRHRLSGHCRINRFAGYYSLRRRSLKATARSARPQFRPAFSARAGDEHKLAFAPRHSRVDCAEAGEGRAGDDRRGAMAI